MTRELSSESQQPPVTLPPKEFWLYDPDRDGLIPTPVDERNLVDAPKLFRVIAGTIHPDYTWNSSFDDVHHLEWPQRWYEDRPDETLANPHQFRNLAISKWVLPRVMHNWIHRVTEPPIMPDDETMHYRIEAQRVTTSLFMKARSTKRFMRASQAGEEEIHRQLMVRFNYFARQLDTLRKVPSEFHPIDLSHCSAETLEDMFTIGTKLARYAVAGTVNDALHLAKAA